MVEVINTECNAFMHCTGGEIVIVSRYVHSIKGMHSHKK